MKISTRKDKNPSLDKHLQIKNTFCVKQNLNINFALVIYIIAENEESKKKLKYNNLQN